MILVDTNLLVYARMSTLPEHAAGAGVAGWTFDDRPRVGMPWQSLLGSCAS